MLFFLKVDLNGSKRIKAKHKTYKCDGCEALEEIIKKHREKKKKKASWMPLFSEHI